VAALQEWPCDWVAEELAAYGVPQVQQQASQIGATGRARRRELVIPRWAASAAERGHRPSQGTWSPAFAVVTILILTLAMAKNTTLLRAIIVALRKAK
jgi:hypothetical protein